MRKFKSINFQFFAYILIIVIGSSLGICFLLKSYYIAAQLCGLVIIYAVYRLYRNHHYYNDNIVFLLDAIQNGDYTFKFSDNISSRNEHKLVQMLNKLKDILIAAKQEAIEKERFLGIIIEDIPTGILILDHNNNIRSANKASLDILGLPVFTHLNQLNVISSDFPEIFRSLQAKEENKQIKIVKEREVVQISLSATNIQIQGNEWRIITLNNIGTELETREMESWMKLIRVMTHEIMNSIAPITSLSEMLLFSYKQDTEWNENLQQQTVDALGTINSTARGLSSFVDSYRQFSGVPKPILAPIELESFLNRLVQLKKADFESQNIYLDINNPLGETIVLGDETLLTRVIVNLLKNAAEALLEKEQNRKIKLSVQKDVDNKIQISIANNGSAIPHEIAENIFIPFYTTKREGSGIGLSISRYIMRLHHGNLKHFEEDGWTVFSLTLVSKG